jgi:hypothetical protein
VVNIQARTFSTILVVISTDYIGKSIYHTSTSSTLLVVISTDYIGKSIYHTSTSSTTLGLSYIVSTYYY